MRRPTAGNAALAVAYVRVSTEEQQNGPEAQRAAISAWAARSGVRVAEWHEDRVSGATPVEDRPALLDALASLVRCGAGLLVVSRRDRLARDIVIAATAEKMAADAGARIVSADGVSAEATPEGALMRGLLDLFASYERALIRSRTAAALAAKRARAEHTGGSRPFGFRIEKGFLHHGGGRAAGHPPGAGPSGGGRPAAADCAGALCRGPGRACAPP